MDRWIDVRTQFDSTISSNHDVVALDITVNNILDMKMIQGSNDLAHNGSNVSLLHRAAGLDDLREIATVDKLHDDPQGTIDQEAVDEAHDGTMCACLHEQNLVDDDLLVGLLVQDHLLDCDLGAGLAIIGHVYCSRSTIDRASENKLVDGLLYVCMWYTYP